MDVEKFYTDACCKHQDNVGSWAVVGMNDCYTGLVSSGEGKVNSGFCELYAVYQALKIADKDKQTIIYNDNQGVVNWLNKDKCNKHTGRENYKELLKKVHPFYHSLDNVKVVYISRKQNKVADKLARKTIKKESDGFSEF